MSAPLDDFSAAFTVEGAPLAGRIVRLGRNSVEPILRRHDHPAPVSLLLGESLAFAALFGSLLKAEGRLSVQARGDGPVRLLVAERAADGALKGTARLAADAGERLAGMRRAPPRVLVGEGVLAVTLDQGPDFAPHQGMVALEDETFARCAEGYFAASEQVETRVRLAVGEVLRADSPPCWRAGGVLLQRIAADNLRGDTEDAWNRAVLFLETLTDEELLDPDLGADRVLYRLFHEDGVRMGAPQSLEDRCSCDEERLMAALAGLTVASLGDLIEPDGAIHANCEFCSRRYRIDPDRLTRARPRPAAGA